MSETQETQMRQKTMQINKKQLNHLATYMENHPQFARGTLQAKNGKVKMHQMWQNLVNTLNSFAPPAKTVKDWKRVWTTQKYNAKEKLSFIKQSHHQTGDGVYNKKSISTIEDQIVQEAGLEIAVTGLQGRLFSPNQCKRRIPLQEISIEPNITDDIDSFEGVDDIIDGQISLELIEEEPAIIEKEPTAATSSTSPKRQEKRKRKSKTEFFEEQCEKMSEINETLQKLVDLKTEANNIAKEKLKLDKQQFYEDKIYKEKKLKLIEMNLNRHINLF